MVKTNQCYYFSIYKNYNLLLVIKFLDLRNKCL